MTNTIERLYPLFRRMCSGDIAYRPIATEKDLVKPKDFKPHLNKLHCICCGRIIALDEEAYRCESKEGGTWRSHPENAKYRYICRKCHETVEKPEDYLGERCCAPTITGCYEHAFELYPALENEYLLFYLQDDRRATGAWHRGANGMFFTTITCNQLWYEQFDTINDFCPEGKLRVKTYLKRENEPCLITDKAWTNGELSRKAVLSFVKVCEGQAKAL